MKQTKLEPSLVDQEKQVLKKVLGSVLGLVVLIAIGAFYLFQKTGNARFSLVEAMKLVTHLQIGIGGSGSLLFFLLSFLGAILSIYLIITLINIFFTDRLKKNIQEARTMRTVAGLKNHYLILGGGSLGASVARSLKEKGKPVVVIEADNERVAELNKQGILAFEGDCFEKTYLTKAKVTLAKVAIACLNDDGDNLLATSLLKELNPNIKVVAEATFEKYASHLKKVGADEVVVPRDISGVYMAKMAGEFE